jgi:hypothetical protein
MNPPHRILNAFRHAFVLITTAPSVTQGLSSASQANWLVARGGGGGVGGGEGSGGCGGGTKAPSGRASNARITACRRCSGVGC